MDFDPCRFLTASCAALLLFLNSYFDFICIKNLILFIISCPKIPLDLAAQCIDRVLSFETSFIQALQLFEKCSWSKELVAYCADRMLFINPLLYQFVITTTMCLLPMHSYTLAMHIRNSGFFSYNLYFVLTIMLFLSNSQVAISCMYALRAEGAPFPLLTIILSSIFLISQNPLVRIEAANWFYDLTQSIYLPCTTVVSVLSKKASIDVALQALILLDRMPALCQKDELVDCLIIRLNDEDITTLSLSIKTIERLGKTAKRALPSLQLLLNNPDRSIRNAARRAILKIKGTDNTPDTP